MAPADASGALTPEVSPGKVHELSARAARLYLMRLSVPVGFRISAYASTRLSSSQAAARTQLPQLLARAAAQGKQVYRDASLGGKTTECPSRHGKPYGDAWNNPPPSTSTAGQIWRSGEGTPPSFPS